MRDTCKQLIEQSTKRFNARIINQLNSIVHVKFHRATDMLNAADLIVQRAMFLHDSSLLDSLSAIRANSTVFYELLSRKFHELHAGLDNGTLGWYVDYT